MDFLYGDCTPIIRKKNQMKSGGNTFLWSAIDAGIACLRFLAILSNFGSGWFSSNRRRVGSMVYRKLSGGFQTLFIFGQLAW